MKNDLSQHQCIGLSLPCDEPVEKAVDFGDEVYFLCRRHYRVYDQRTRRTCGKSIEKAAEQSRHQIS